MKSSEIPRHNAASQLAPFKRSDEKYLIDVTASCSCACANLKRTDLVVTQFYDGVLAPSGLYAVQFGLLAALSRLGTTTINALAEVMDMDRMALSRQLKILIDMGLVCYGENQDERTIQVLMTQEGEQAIKDAWPFWEEAQKRIETTFGRARFDALLDELAAMRALLGSDNS